MKKYFILFFLFIAFISLNAQNAIVGTGFTTGWGSTCASPNATDYTYLSANIGTTYSSGDLTPKGTGNQYWRLAIGWGGTFYQVSNGSDMAIAPGVKTNATVSCTSTGAYYRNVSALTNRYVFKTLNAGVSPTGTWVFFELGGASTTVSSVSLSPANPTVNNVGTVTATLSAALPTGQAVYLRYSTDNFATSTVTSMTGSGTSYTAYIGTQALNAVVKYYVFTSGSGLTIASADADLYTINWNAGSLNGGSNYSYTVAAGATLLQSLLIDFGPADGTNGDTIAVADANGKFWNNITKTATTDPQKQLRNTSGIPLTGYSLAITASGFITNGKGNGGLRTPYTSQFTTGGTDTNLAIGTATEDFFYAASGTSPAFKISGLNPNKKYMFKIFGSRAGNSARNAQYSIVGAATTVGNLDNSRTSAYNSVFMLTTGYNSDTNNGYQLTSGGSYTLSTPYYGNNLYSYNTDYITPLNVSGSGQFTLTMSSPLYAQNCFINCMKMEEYKGEQTITLAATGTKTVGDADYSPATASSTLTIGYASSNSAVATIVSGQIHIVGVGTTTITASQAGDATYEAATNVTQLLTVNAAAPIAQTITFGALSAKVYGDINFSPGASASSGLTVSYTSSNTAVATIASGQIHIVGVGTSTITASQAGDAAYFAATNATQTLTVNSSGIPTLQQSLFFDFGPSDGTNGDNTTNPDSYGNNWNNISNAAGSTAMPTSPAAGSSFSNLINSANSATTYGLSFTVAGFTSNGKQNGGLLSPTSALGEFNTATATEDYIYTNSASNGPTVKITGLATHKKYRFIIFGYRNTANTRTSNYTIVGTDSVNVARTLNGTLNTSANVSTCYYSNFVYPNSSNEISLTTVTPTAASDNFAYINCMKLEEYKGGQAITFGALPTKNTSDANFAPGATTNSALTISYISSNTAVATIVSGQIHIVGEGTCTITASQVGDATYDAATDATQLLTVTNKTAQTITFSALSAKTVGDATFNLTASASSTLTVSYSSSSTAVATISGSTVTIVGAGTTDITASQSGNGTYAAASNVTQTLTVNGAGTPTLNQSLYFDFGPNDVTNGDNTNGADANGHYWNNINSTSNNATVSSLKNVANSATAYTLVLTNAGFTTNGKLNGGLLSSDPAKLGEFAVNTATEDYFYTTSSGAFKITGLDIAKQYKFKIFGSRTNATDRTTQYSIQGTGSAVVGTLQTSLANLGGTGYDGNNSSIYTTDYIYPNNSGEISVSASIMGSGVYAYINAMKLEEYTTPNVDVVSIAISGSNISATAASSQMNVVYTPSYATHKSITWSVDNTSNAIIDANGLLTPKKNSTVNVTASLQLNGSPISTTKQITISNQLTNLYLSGTATSNGDDVATALSMNASPTLSGIPNGVFEIATTLNASGTLHFYTTQDVSATIYGAGGTAGTVQSGGAAITPTLSGTVLIRVNLVANTYNIYPVNPLKISQMGSSVSHGFGATSYQGYAYQYNQLLHQRYLDGKGANWALSNISVDGNTTTLVLNRWDADLLNDGSKYVVYGLSLGNEGIVGGGQAIYDQFKTNMTFLIDKARSVGKVPIVTNNNARDNYGASEYSYIKQMNMEMHQWDVPSVNLLGSLDNGAGHWVTGYLFDANHPNDAGHTELSYAIVPSLYDALNAGKAQPLKKIGTYLSMGSSMPYDKLVFTPDNLIHSFTVTFDIKTSATGVISTFKQGITTGTISINASTGYLSYTSPTGQTITGSTVVNNGQWHKITLSHYYARGETLLYSDNVLTGTKSEKLLATDFYLNDGNAPVNIDYRDWFFYRAGMNADEIAGLNSGLMLKSSLELYAPLDGQGILGSDVLQNLAQSTNVVTRIQPTTINVSSNLTEAAISNPAADVTISGTGTTLSIGANKMVNSVTVDAGAKLDFSTANTLTITGDLILKATEMNTETTSFSANIGSGTLAVGGDIKYLKTIDDQKWYFISLPSDVQISTISGNPALGALGTDWFIKYYDGEQRGISGVTFVNWKMITPTMTATTYPKLNKYQGYIIGLLSGSSEITFTLDKSILSTEASSRNIPVAANNAGVISPTHHGWNLIGQPYLSQYIGKDGSNVSNTTGATAYNIYMSDGTSTYTPYTQATIPDINPMSAYFIQASNELAESGITFGLAGRRQLAPAMVTTDLSDVLKLNFTSTTGTDYTLLTMDNSHTTAYEIGYDLEKWIGTGTSKPQVYTVLGGINYAFNALPMSSVVNLPLAIYTQTTGSTTISVDASKAQSLSKLLLTDNEVTPVSVTDLLVSNYTFTAAAGTNNSRFAITAQRITTDNNVIGNEKDETQFIINNSQLTIRNLARNTTVRVYDALGRMIIRNNAASNTIEIKLNVRGVYTVQLQSGTTISNRKVIF